MQEQTQLAEQQNHEKNKDASHESPRRLHACSRGFKRLNDEDERSGPSKRSMTVQLRPEPRASPANRLGGLLNLRCVAAISILGVLVVAACLRQLLPEHVHDVLADGQAKAQYHHNIKA